MLHDRVPISSNPGSHTGVQLDPACSVLVHSLPASPFSGGVDASHVHIGVEHSMSGTSLSAFPHSCVGLQSRSKLACGQ